MPTFRRDNPNGWGSILTYFKYHPFSSKYKPHQGAKECARRVANGQAGMCYIHGGQYGS